MFIYRILTSNSGISDKLVVTLASILAIFFSIIMHEVAHGYAAKLNGDYTAKSAGRLTLNPVIHFDLWGVLMMLLVGFGWAKPVPVNPANFRNRKLGMITVSLAGVITNLLLAGLSLLLLYLFAPLFVIPVTNAAAAVFRTLGLHFLLQMASLNFMLAFFNLMPIYPLDGYNLVNTFLPYGNPYQRFMVRYGFFVLIGLIVLSQIGRAFNAPYLDIFGMFYDLVYKLIQRVLAAGLGVK